MHPGRRGPRNLEKAKDFKKSMLTLVSYCKPYLIPVIVSIILAMISSILSIIGPDKLKDITNLITQGLMTGIDMTEVKRIVLLLACIYIISAVFGYIQHYIMAVVTNKFSKQLRKEISEKINRMPLKYFDKNSYGDILSRVTNDVDTLSQTLNQSLGTLVSAITLLIGSILMMFITNGLMALTAIFSSVFGFIFMFMIIGRSQKYFEKLQNEIGELNGHIEEMYSGHNVVRVYNGTKKSNEEFDEINNRLSENVRKSQFLSGLMHPFMGFIGNFGYVCVCIVGAILTMNEVIDFGVIVAFMMYVRLFTQPLNQIAQSISSLQSCAASSERVFEFLDEEEMTSENHLTKKLVRNEVKGAIEFKHVKFGYDEDKTIIKDFNVSVKPGEKIAIVGPTGAGKTTMVNLLMKFYDIKDGDILIDEVSTKELTRKNIHDLFIMVLQDTWVFEGTINENIKYNKTNVTDERVKEVCKVVGLHHYIKSLPNGYNTILTDNETLSSGQKQLLTIARGMIEDAPFLILDEATSSVDTRTEELVQKAMDKLTEGRTSFIIAHRLSTIKNADLILMMQEGNIVEYGTHEELLKLNGKYAELYNSQFEKLEE
ncbi:MAG: ABC transporter ATP-binding protein [Bacilli bacterium]|nr:ABC transporter ATP-binding protein [Bacilli bacterium]